VEGTKVRLTGQDSARGTFSHRHAVYTDTRTGERWVPLNHVQAGQNVFMMVNTPLSEEAVLGFEYGYSTTDPGTLVCWEAQFGDFANGAQVVIDQLIASCELKWGRRSGLVLMLPHGYEGQGPEHSSARLERFLELCAEDNMQVCNLSTPAQHFHVLRRQVRRPFRRPLVLMTPKSLLRHEKAVSRTADLTDGTFRELIDDTLPAGDRRRVRRLLLCSGRIYWTLAAAREGRDDRRDVAIARLEQLYPFPHDELARVLATYPALEQLTWVQEEPQNMGAWRALRHRFEKALPRGVGLAYAGRHSAAVPATGSHEVHVREEAALVDAAFAPEGGRIAGERQAAAQAPADARLRAGRS
jgi:2-oxoglutarate dehydrogenase E1 component